MREVDVHGHDPHILRPGGGVSVDIVVRHVRGVLPVRRSDTLVMTPAPLWSALLLGSLKPGLLPRYLLHPHSSLLSHPAHAVKSKLLKLAAQVIPESHDMMLS